MTADVSLFYFLDNTKGVNPFVWWFPVSILYTVIAGLLSVMMYLGLFKKNKKSDSWALFWQSPSVIILYEY